MSFMRLSNDHRKALEREIIPAEARLQFTRMIREKCSSVVDDDSEVINLLHENNYVNMANNVMGRPIYTLESDDWGDYQPAEFAWHHGQRELIMRVSSTIELTEILADYLQQDMLDRDRINDILKQCNCGFHFEDQGTMDGVDIAVIIDDEESIPSPDLSNDHPNVRSLIARMEAALIAKDYSAVLHASASVFETLAKDVTQKPSVNNQTLKSFFDSYRKKSMLPEPILDYMLEVYNDRNKVPLAGHGNLSKPTTTCEQATSLAELTKSIVRIERLLTQQEVDLRQSPQPVHPAEVTTPAATMPSEPPTADSNS